MAGKKIFTDYEFQTSAFLVTPKVHTVANIGTHTGVAGQLATASSNLYFHDGSNWYALIESNFNGSLTGVPNFNPSTGNVPFTIQSGANDKVANLNADLLDGYDTSTTAVASKIPVYGTSGVLKVGTPSDDLDAANKSYVDQAIEGLDVKPSVAAASTANLTLSGTQTVDGVSLSAGDRILVKNQSTASQNGIYVVASGSWALAEDSDAGSLSEGAYVFVEGGTANNNTGWTYTDASAYTWSQFSGAGQLTAGDGLTKSGDTLSVDAAAPLGISGGQLAITGTIPVTSGGTGSSTQETSGRVLITGSNGVYTTDAGLTYNSGSDLLTVSSASNNTIYGPNFIRATGGSWYLDNYTVGGSINFRVSDSSSIDTTALVINSDGDIRVGERLGIGVDPTAALTVRHDTVPQMVLGYATGTNEHRIYWDSSKLFLSADHNGAVDNSGLLMLVNGSTVLEAEDNGDIRIPNKLGVGKTPGVPLDVMQTGDSIKADFTNNVNANFRIKTSGSNTQIGPSTASNLELQTGNTTRLTIDSSGNAIFQKGGGAYLQLKDASAVRGSINVTTSDGLTFTTGSSFTTRLSIESDGDVQAHNKLGVGGSPVSALHVFSSTADALRLQRTGVSDWRIQLTDGSLAFRDATADSERMRLTSTPVLQLSGDTHNWSTAAQLHFISSSTQSDNVRDWAVGSADTNYGNFHIFNGGTRGTTPTGATLADAGFTITYDNKFGFGTKGPGAKLEAKTAHDTNAFIVRASNDNNLTHNFWIDSGGNGAAQIYADGSLGRVRLHSAGTSYFTGGPVGVGIEGANANTKLHVRESNPGSFTYDTTADTLIVEGNGDSGITIATAAANTSRIIFASPNDPTGAEIGYSNATKLLTVGITSANGQTRFLSGNGVEAGRFDASGNFGLGSTSPTAKFQINDDYTTSSYGGGDLYVKGSSSRSSYDPDAENTTDLQALITVSSNNTTGPDKPGLILHNDDNTAGGFSPMLLFSKRETGSSDFKATMAGIYARSPLGTGNSDSWIDGELIFATAGAASEGIKQRMVINKEGLVGIGSTDPDTLLDVVGSDPVLTIRDSETSVASASAALRLGESGASDALNNHFDIKFVGTGSGGDLDISRYNNTSLLYQGLRIKHDGSVGVGTTSPDSGLTIAKSQTSAHTYTTNHLHLATPTTSNNGGATTISFATSTVDNYGWSLSAIRETTTGNDTRFAFKSHNNSDSGSEVLSILENGSVGVGTASPQQILFVQPASDVNFGISNSGAALRLNALNNAADTNVPMEFTGSRFGFLTGNVGIGIATPDEKLTVKGGNIGIVPSAGTNTGAQGEIRLFGHESVTSRFAAISCFNTGGTDQNALAFYTGSGGTQTRQMTIMETGQVGINNNDPDNLFSTADNLVVGPLSGDNGITICSGTSGGGNIYFADGTSGDQSYRGYIGYSHSTDTMSISSSAELKFRTAGSERIKVSATGQVGINNSAPDTFYSESDNLIIGPLSGDNGITICSGTSGTGSIFFADGDSGADEYRGQIRYGHNGNFMMFVVNANEVMRLTTTGQSITGSQTIKTNSNQLRLETSTSPTTFYSEISSRYDAAHPFELTVANNSSTAVEYIGVYADGGGANNRLYLNGPVGVGTTSPGTTKLRVVSNANQIFKADDGANAKFIVEAAGAVKATRDGGSNALQVARIHDGSLTGNGSATAFTVTHNLETNKPIAQVIDHTTGAYVETQIVVASDNTITVTFNTAPANGKVYRVPVTG